MTRGRGPSTAASRCLPSTATSTSVRTWTGGQGPGPRLPGGGQAAGGPAERDGQPEAAEPEGGSGGTGQAAADHPRGEGAGHAGGDERRRRHVTPRPGP